MGQETIVPLFWNHNLVKTRNKNGKLKQFLLYEKKECKVQLFSSSDRKNLHCKEVNRNHALATILPAALLLPYFSNSKQ